MYVAVIIPLVNVMIDGNCCSSVVCSLDSDIILRSCDRVLFKFYRKKLESYSEAFAGAEGFATSLSEDIVDLSETADVLDLLFQFMLLAPQPDLTSLDFSLLHPLAEAVEKYAVFAATPPCETSMKCVCLPVGRASDLTVCS